MKYKQLWIALLAVVALAAWKLYSNQQKKADKIEMAKITRAFVPVEVVEVRQSHLSDDLEADGIFLPGKEMPLISETAGRVIAVFKNKGEWVNEGEVIAKVDDEMLQIELEATRATIAKLRKDRERLTNLIEGEAAPKNKIEDIELSLMAAEAKEKGLSKQISNTSIKSPMSGVLALRVIDRGSVIGPGVQMGLITNLQKLLLIVKVTERDVLHLKKGQLVTAIPDVFPDMKVQGSVTNIGLRADNAFTYDVEIEIKNPNDDLLRGGMHAKAVFQIGTPRMGLVLPRKAVAGSIQEAAVFVVKDSVALKRNIRLGQVFGDQVEVASGLGEGDWVVVSGQINLTDSAKVNVIKK